jgi:hypothetical protein
VSTASLLSSAKDPHRKLSMQSELALASAFEKRGRETACPMHCMRDFITPCLIELGELQRDRTGGQDR